MSDVALERDRFLSRSWLYLTIAYASTSLLLPAVHPPRQQPLRPWRPSRREPGDADLASGGRNENHFSEVDIDIHSRITKYMGLLSKQGEVWHGAHVF
jgi:hypothetical protein